MHPQTNPPLPSIGRRDFTDEDFDFSDEEDNQAYQPAGQKKNWIQVNGKKQPPIPSSGPPPGPGPGLRPSNNNNSNNNNNPNTPPQSPRKESNSDLNYPNVSQQKSKTKPNPPQSPTRNRSDSKLLEINTIRATNAQTLLNSMETATSLEAAARDAKSNRSKLEKDILWDSKKSNELENRVLELKALQSSKLKEASLAEKNAEESVLRKIKALEQSGINSIELEAALLNASELQDKRVKAELQKKLYMDEMEVVKFEMERLAVVRGEKEEERRNMEIEARAMEEEAKARLVDKMKMAAVNESSKRELEEGVRVLSDLKERRDEADKRAEESLREQAEMVRVEEEMKVERLRRQGEMETMIDEGKRMEVERERRAQERWEAVKRKEIDEGEAVRAEKEATEAKIRREAMEAELQAQILRSEQAKNEADSAEKLRKSMLEKLEAERLLAKEAEEEAVEGTRRRLEAAAKTEEEKNILLSLAKENEALSEKKRFVEKKLRIEKTKANEMERDATREEERRKEADNRRNREVLAARQAEEQADAEIKRRLELVKVTETEREEFEKALKTADAHRKAKVEAEEKMTEVEAELKAVQEANDAAREKIAVQRKIAEDELAAQAAELEVLRNKAKRAKEEARQAIDETKAAQDMADQAKALQRESGDDEAALAKARENGKTTRAEMSDVVEKLRAQLNEQLELQEARAEHDREIKALGEQLEQQKKVADAKEREIFRRETIKLKESNDQAMEEMVKAEKSRLAEHAKMLDDLAKEGESLKKKRQELEDLRDEEGKALEAMKERNRIRSEEAMAQQGGAKVLHSKRSLFEILEKTKDASADQAGEVELEQTLEEVLEGEEEEEEGGEDSNDKNLDIVCSACRQNRGDLPVVHFSAASGHLECLTSINNANHDSISSSDQAQRSPLFYACANTQSMTALFLIEVQPKLVMLCDRNGDTPLHAASSAGSAELIEILLSRGGAQVNQANLLGISPAHLATNRRCLEVLFDAGCDLYGSDKQGRSPLFVACAMNRRDCAEFICEIIEIEGGSFQEVDKRGDTPLHAAACNGSDDCCRLLLDLAVEPGVRNLKGLRPIELASRRGHQSCEQLLAEFHLHHASTDSNFDSVFFLATLQGHRSLKTEMDGSGDDVYEIISKAMPDGSNEAKAAIPKNASMWSLRKGRSVRLQQWGTWICYEDQNVGSMFWYNQMTQENSWEKPEEVVALQEKALMSASSRWDQLQKTGSMRIKKIGEWIQYTGNGGRTFYFNERTFEFQWEKPDDLDEIEVKEEKEREKEKEKEEEGEGLFDDDMAEIRARDVKKAVVRRQSSQKRPPPSSSKKQQIAQVQREQTKLMQEWTTYRDPATQLTFWHNKVSGESLWEPPEGFAEMERKLEMMMEELKEEEEEGEAMVVSGEDELGI